MLTIFALPKAFRGHLKVIQENAVRSWQKLVPSCEIILFGDDEGTAELAAELGITHVPEVEKNEYGTPLVSYIFGRAQEMARYDLVCYINSDIILTGEFLKAIQLAREMPSLIIGRRWDIDLKEPLDFEEPDWEAKFLDRVAKEGSPHGISGIDYFLFPRGTYREIPPFAIGRTAWDNWLIYRARSLKLPVIDATEVVTVVHQNHDFSHIKTIKEGDALKLRKGVEGERNRALLGGVYHAFSLLDATHALTGEGLKSTATRNARYLYHRWLRLPETHPGWFPLVQVVKAFRYAVHSVVKGT